MLLALCKRSSYPGVETWLFVFVVVARDKGEGEVRYGGEGPDHGPRMSVDEETRGVGVNGEHG